MEEFYGWNDLILADRDLVESGADEILEYAKVSFSYFNGYLKSFLFYVYITDSNPDFWPNWESRNLVLNLKAKPCVEIQ